MDKSIEEIKVLKLHNAQRDSHFNKDYIAFATQPSENLFRSIKG